MQAGRARDREYLYLLSVSSPRLWGPELEMKTGRRRDEEEGEGMESCPRMDGGRDG